MIQVILISFRDDASITHTEGICICSSIWGVCLYSQKQSQLLVVSSNTGVIQQKEKRARQKLYNLLVFLKLCL